MIVGLMALSPAVLSGCGEGKDRFFVQILQIQEGPGLGDDPADGFLDGFLTPSLTRIGVTNVTLIGDDETDDFTILKANDSASAVEIELRDTAQELAEKGDLPAGCECRFTKASIELTFVEYTIEIFFSGSPSNRRIRLYLASFKDTNILGGLAVQAGDVLIEENGAFHWIDTQNGTLELADPTQSNQNRPTQTLVVPANRFPKDVYAGPFIFDLPESFIVPKKPKGDFFVTLEVDVEDAFFFDDVDANGRFDRSPDGDLNENATDSRFYPDFPRIRVAAE